MKRLCLGFYPRGVDDVDALQTATVAYLRGLELAASESTSLQAADKARKLTRRFANATGCTPIIVQMPAPIPERWPREDIADLRSDYDNYDREPNNE